VINRIINTKPVSLYAQYASGLWIFAVAGTEKPTPFLHLTT
jgi:hypothetical protein